MLLGDLKLPKEEALSSAFTENLQAEGYILPNWNYLSCKKQIQESILEDIPVAPLNVSESPELLQNPFTSIYVAKEAIEN